jgi:hypothetical protein
MTKGVRRGIGRLSMSEIMGVSSISEVTRGVISGRSRTSARNAALRLRVTSAMVAKMENRDSKRGSQISPAKPTTDEELADPRFYPRLARCD